MPGTLCEGAALLRAAVMTIREAWKNQREITAQWELLGYPTPPDFDRAAEEYDAYAMLLQEAGVRLDELWGDPEMGLDAIAVRDAGVVLPGGLVTTRPNHPSRSAEARLLHKFFAGQGEAVLGQIAGTARLRGGDVLWLDEETLVVATGAHTNAAGVEQLRTFLPEGVAVEAVTLSAPVGAAGGAPAGAAGRRDTRLVAHVAPLGSDLALLDKEGAGDALARLLERRGVRIIEVPGAEAATLMGALVLGPRLAAIADGHPGTRAALQDAGVEVVTYPAVELAKAGHGPAALCLPLTRM